MSSDRKYILSSFSLLCSGLVALVLMLPNSAAAQQSSGDSPALEPDPHTSRLIFSGTARPLGEGEVYASLSNIVVPQLGYGVTGKLSIEVGGQFIPRLEPKLFYLDPMVQIWQRDNLHIAAGSRLSMIRGRQYSVYGVGSRSRIFATTDRRTIDEGWDLYWQPKVLATTGGSRGALTGGVGLQVSTAGSDPRGSYFESAYLQVGAELQLLPWMRFISESEIHGGYTDRFVGRESNSRGGFDVRVTESTGAYLQSANTLRLHGDHFATEIGVGVQALTNPVIKTNDTDLFGIVRFTYQF